MKLTDNHLKLFGLFFGCPEIKALPDCPLEKYRKKTAIEKMKTLESLSMDELRCLNDLHDNCVKARVNKRFHLTTV